MFHFYIDTIVFALLLCGIVVYNIRLDRRLSCVSGVHFLHGRRVSIFLFLILFSGVFFTEWGTFRTIERFYASVKFYANSLTQTINPLIAELICSEEDKAALSESEKNRFEEAFSRIKSQMQVWSATNQLSLVCSLKLSQGKLYLGPQTSFVDSTLESLSQLFTIIPEQELLSIFSRPQIIVFPENKVFHDKIYAISPLLNPRDGNTIMLIVVQKSFLEESRQLLQKRIVFFTCFLLLSFFLVKSRFIICSGQQILFSSTLTRCFETVVVFLFGLLMTLFAVYNVYFSGKLLQKTIFENLADVKAALLRKQIEQIELQYDGLISYFAVNSQVSLAEFNEFANYLMMRGSMVAWGFCPYQDSETYPITYLYPLAGNETVIGYNIYTEKLRRQALQTAIHSGLPTATKPLYLVQDQKDIISMSVFQPLYHRLAHQQDEKKFVGFAVLAVRLEPMFRLAIFAEGVEHSEINASFYQLDSSGNKSSVITIPRHSPSNPLFTISYPVHFFGQNWIMQISPSSYFTDINPLLRAVRSFLFGFFISVLLAFFVDFLRRQQTILETKVQERTIALQKSEERFFTTLNSIGDAVVSTDTKGYIIYVNPVAEKVLGSCSSELIGRLSTDVFCLYNSINGQVVSNPVEEVLNTGQIFGLSNHTILRALDGSEKHIADSAAPIKIANGEITGAVMVFSDVTKQYQIRRELQRIRASVERLTEGIAIANTDGLVWFVNKSWALLHGYDDEKELIGTHLSLFHSPEQYEKEIKPLNEQVLQTGFGEQEVGHLKKDGTTFPAMMSVCVERNEAGQACGLIAVMRDTSKERLMQERLQQSERMESIGRLAAGVAHDLNNFLSPIMAYADLLYNDLHVKEEQREQLGEIRKATVSMKSLVQQLLVFGRQQELSVASCSLADLLHDLEPLIRGVIHSSLELKYVFSDQPLRINADAHQFARVIMNLAINAQDAMPNGGTIEIKLEKLNDDLRKKIGVSLLKNLDYAVISISDTGIGMSAETQKNIFEPFYTTKGSLGNGLGLSIAYGIVKQHGGTIFVDSVLNQGSCFFICLPLLENTTLPKEASNFATKTATLIKRFVLLVEDNEIVRRMTNVVLESLGFEVVACPNAQEAMSILRREAHIILLLTDVVMPNIDGKTLARQAKALRPEIKILFMSGYTDNILDIKDKTDYNFIRKPFSVLELEHKINCLLQGAV